MSKRKVMFCRDCCEDTVHEFINKETVADGTGILRAALAVMSLGLSESPLSATYWWQCTKCGNIDDE